MSMWQQLFIFAGVLILAPLALRLAFWLLVKLKLFPLALYLAVTRLIFTGWLAAHGTADVVVLAVLALLTVVLWLSGPIRSCRENRQANDMVALHLRLARDQGLTDDRFSLRMEAGIPILERKE